MTKAKKILLAIWAELLIVGVFIFALNNYVGHQDSKINADGIGYYDYLPSIFIHHDFHRNNATENEDPGLYDRILKFGGYVEHNDYRVNKYPAGTATLQAPFFFMSWMISEDDSNLTGYESNFQNGIYFSAIFYLFLTLVLFKYLLSKKTGAWLIHGLQLLMVLATSITHYANNDAAYSHVYSLFAITLFLFLAKQYLQNPKTSYIILSCFVLGLITILRPTNILVLLFIPFIAENIDALKKSMNKLWQDKKGVLLGLIAFGLILLYQMILWYSQTGSWIVYSYGEEGFNFLAPELFNVLFSYSKGLFVYTPILLFVFPTLLILGLQKRYYILLSWLIPMLLVTYVISSWWAWDYGCSYGMRPFVEYYSLFFVLFGWMLAKLHTWVKIVFLIVGSVLIPINIIQTYQYKEYILLWMGTTEEDYWKVFLKTDVTYKGWLWKRQFNLNEGFEKVDEIDIGDILTNQDAGLTVVEQPCSSIIGFDKVSVIKIELVDSFLDGDQSKFVVEISDTITHQNHYWYQFYLGILAEENRNQKQRGEIQLEIPITEELKDKQLKIGYVDHSKVRKLEEVKVSFYAVSSE